jgi:hypothetical protein
MPLAGKLVPRAGDRPASARDPIDRIVRNAPSNGVILHGVVSRAFGSRPA